MDEINCMLLTANEKGEWEQLHQLLRLEITSSHIKISCAAKHELILEVPAVCWASMQQVNPSLVVIAMETQRIALQFLDHSQCENFVQKLHFEVQGSQITSVVAVQNCCQMNTDYCSSSQQVPVTETATREFLFPDLRDSVVQQQVLQLLFNEDFQKFVGEMQMLLKEFQKNVQS